MNKKIKIINNISLVAILFFPFYFLIGVMSLSTPTAPEYMKTWFYIIATYPLFIVAMLFLSRKLKSLPCAILGLLPLIGFILVFIFMGILVFQG